MGNFFSEQRYVGDVDLVTAAKNELSFLRSVEKFKHKLYDPESPYMKEAIRRYTDVWLPLIVERGNSGCNDVIVGPLDVEWLSHTHRLSPTMYDADLKSFGATVIPPHRLLDRQQHADAQLMARRLWQEKYLNEPFENSLGVDKGVKNSHGDDKGANNSQGDDKEANNSRGDDKEAKTEKEVLAAQLEGKKNGKKLQYDLVDAVKRQQMFYYQVSLPHYRKSAFLSEAVQRYRRFLKLKRENPGQFFVPCYDFDLIWHAHQAHAREYAEYTQQFLGNTLPHDDSVNDRVPGSKLNDGEALTRAAWKKAFPSSSFFGDGCMWRGNPPHTWLAKIPAGSIGNREMLAFKKGSFQQGMARDFLWAFKGLSISPKAETEWSSPVLYALHDILDTAGLRVLIIHNQKWSFSAVYVISAWEPVNTFSATLSDIAAAATSPAAGDNAAAAAASALSPSNLIPDIYACAHLASRDQLPTFEGNDRNPSLFTDYPTLMEDEKKSHQKRGIVVKSADRDDSILIGFWAGRRKYNPGCLQVHRYDLSPSLWGEKKFHADFARGRIQSSIQVPSSLAFSIGDTGVNFNTGVVNFNKDISATEKCLGVASAFSVAMLQVLLQPRLADGNIPVPDPKKHPNAVVTHDSDFLIMAGIHQHAYIATSLYYINAVGGCGGCGSSCAGCGVGASSCGAGGSCGADGGGGDGGGDGGGACGGCGGCGGGCGG